MSHPDLEKLSQEARGELEGAKDARALEEARIRWLGRKGRIASLMAGIPDLPPEQRREAGRGLNALKDTLAALHETLVKALSGPSDASVGALDVTHPGRRPHTGSIHPITQTRRAIEEIFRQMGFDVAEGPDVESEYYNFEALNIPAHHPARGMFDTFFTKNPPGLVLRTHTSPVQIRTMESQPPPVRIIVPGRVYRNDTPDASHSPYFHQIEGLYVDEGVSMPMLRGVLDVFAHRMFGRQLKTRFRASYFPFTEPSAEMDVSCFNCGGDGCAVCKGTGWVEILGCGMVNPALYGFVDYDARRLTGYAFGMGVERIAMPLFGIHDIRLFSENDLRLLEQC